MNTDTLTTKQQCQNLINRKHKQILKLNSEIELIEIRKEQVKHSEDNQLTINPKFIKG